MICDCCGSNRVFSISAKSSDLNFVQYNGVEHDGYAPLVDNICGGDYVDVAICLDCGKTQGNFPVDEPDFRC